jgi:hypothetical protein
MSSELNYPLGSAKGSRGQRVSVGYISFLNFSCTYIFLKIEARIIIKVIINSYSFYAVTLEEVKTSNI